MAYNNLFSFASNTDLWQCWMEPSCASKSDTWIDFFGDYHPVETFPVEMILTSPDPVPSPDPVSSPDVGPNTPYLINEYNMPNQGFQWEYPLPIMTPTPALNDSLELDRALSSPEEQQTLSMSYTSRDHPQLFSPPLTPPEPHSKKRYHEDCEEDIDIDCVKLDESLGYALEDDPTNGFKLPASKSPIMEAMVVCAINGWGIELWKNIRPTATTPAEVTFKVTDFNRYYKISRAICSKQRPTDDLGSRIKSLRRWFVNFPKKKDRSENCFFLEVKPTIAKKVNEIIERNSRSVGLVKRSRKQ